MSIDLGGGQLELKSVNTSLQSLLNDLATLLQKLTVTTSASLDLDVEQTLKEVIATYENERGNGFKLGEAEPERLIIYVMAYRLVLLKGLIKRV